MSNFDPSEFESVDELNEDFLDDLELDFELDDCLTLDDVREVESFFEEDIPY